MNNKNKELMNAVVILSWVSLVFSAIVVCVILAVLALTLLPVGISMADIAVIGGADIQTSIAVMGLGKLSSFVFGFAVLTVLVSLSMKICAVVFATKAKNNNSTGSLLVASILNAVGLLSGDVVAIAAAVCGFILYSDVSGGNNNSDDSVDVKDEYQDNIYGMKR